MPAITKVTLVLKDGTLFAVPNGGHLRAKGGTALTWNADFPFRLEFTALVGGNAPPPADALEKAGTYEFTLKLDPVPDGSDPPSFKYTVKARGKVLDPIIIVDKGHL